VLVRGATAEAKRSLAEALHRRSGRAGRFVAVDCGALGALGADSLEAALFGDAARPGALAEAADGTLLLEEVGELPPPLQDRLLQAIESGEAARASGEPVAGTARLVSATDRDLLASIEARAFRPDLFYRLAGATLTLRMPRVLTPAEEEERRQVIDALEEAGGNLTRAARRLGTTRNVIVMKLSQYQIPRPAPVRR
jgi:DNA-binding NtrC family response regulator